MGRRVLAFFLGMIFGMIFLIGGLGLGVYLAATKLKPSDITSDASNYVGDFADMSLVDMVNSVKALYSEKAGVADSSGNYYTLGEFLDNYNVNLEATLGFSLPQSLLDVPVFEYFQEGGIDRALDQITLATIPDLLNLFVSGEDGNAYVSDDVVEELCQYTVKDLIDEDKGISYVFQNISLNQLLPDMFPDNSAENPLMHAVGKTKIGKLLKALNGSDSLFLQVKEGGALENLGTLALTDLLGGSTGIIETVLGDTVVSDLVNDNGAVDFDGVLNGLYVGTLLSCIRNEIEVENIGNYTVELDGKTDATKLWSTQINGKTVIFGMDGDKYYQKDVTCNENHAHTASCYEFVWYNSVTIDEKHDCSETEFVDKDGKHHERITGLYKALVNMGINDVIGGSADSILQRIKGVTLGELAGNKLSGILLKLADKTVGELMSGNFDGIYVGSLLGYERTEITDFTGFGDEKIEGIKENGSTAIKLDDGTWYEAELTCSGITDEHKQHTADCYGFVWNKDGERVDGLYTAFVNLEISDLVNGTADILEELKSVRLGDILGDNDNVSGILASLADKTVGDLMNGDFDGIYLGQLLGYERTEVESGSAFAKQDGDKWYAAELTCTTDHKHDDSCYEFVWSKDGEPADGIYKALANLEISDLMNGADIILEKLKEVKIGDVLDDNTSGMLANFADMTVGELLDGGFEDLYLGSLLGCKKNSIDDTSEYEETVFEDGTIWHNKSGDCYAIDDGDKLYEAVLTCSDESCEHNKASCYGYVWYNEDDNGDLTPVDGLYKALVNLSIGEIMNGTDAILEKMKDVKLGDIVGGEINGVLANFADMTIGEMMDGKFDNIFLGGILGYEREEVVDTNDFKDVTNGIMENGSAAIKLDEGTWYKAELTCTDASAEHTHNDSCYDFVWNKDGEPVEGLFKALVNVKLADLTGGSTDVILQKLKVVKLSDVLGDNISGVLANFANMTIGDLMDGKMESLYLGELLGYLRKEITNIDQFTDVSEIDGIKANNGHFAKQEGNVWYEVQFTCTDTSAEHKCNANCYDFVWFEKETLGGEGHDGCTWGDELIDSNNMHHAPITGLYKALVNVKISELTDGSDVILNKLKSIALRDIVGDNVSGALAGFVDMTIGELMDGAIDDMYLGTMLSCIRKPIANITGTTTVVEDENGIVLENVSGLLVKQDGDDWFEAELTCKNSSKDHNHTSDCYGYVWYNSLTAPDGHNCNEANEYIDEDGHHLRIDGLYKALVNVKLADMMDGDTNMLLEKIKDIPLRDLVKGDIDGVLESFADMTIRELVDGGVDSLYLGDFLGYNRTTTDAPASYNTVELQEGEKWKTFYVGTIGDQLVMSDDATTWYTAKLVCTETDNTTHSHERSCYAYVWKNGENEVSSLMSKLAEKKVGELDSINDTIMTLTLGDVLGDELNNGLLVELKDTPINQLSSQIDSLYLGSAIGYYRKEVTDFRGFGNETIEGIRASSSTTAKFDGKKWYVAELTCTDASAEHTHDANCYEYVWYTDAACETPVDGVKKAFVNSKLNNVSDTIDSLTLNKLGISGDNNILKALGDTKITNLSEELNDMKLGTMFGFVPNGKTWYEPCQDGCKESHDHKTIEGKEGFFMPAKGINAKMSDMTINDLTSGDGMTKIVKDFTIRDMQDSGIVSFEEEQEYKLDIIFDSSKQCSLYEYLGASNLQGTTAKAYYQYKHETDETYRGTWKDMTVTEFLDTMLSLI